MTDKPHVTMNIGKRVGCHVVDACEHYCRQLALRRKSDDARALLDFADELRRMLELRHIEVEMLDCEQMEEP